MPAAVFAVGFDGGNVLLGKSAKAGKVASAANIQDTLERLQNERDKYKKEKENTESKVIDKKIENLENRISNLQKRLDKIKSEEDDGECQTCKNRKYQDESNDPGVSFKTASKINPAGVEAAVRGHEQEHVTRNQAKADREGKEIVYQNVTIKRAICPECGKSYVAGGETKTVTRTKQDERFEIGLRDEEQDKGNYLDIKV